MRSKKQKTNKLLLGNVDNWVLDGQGVYSEYLATLPREDKIMLAAVARLNQEEQQENLKKAVLEAAAFIMGKMKG